MADPSVRSKVIDRLVADLEAIEAGTEYHYTVAQVLRWQTPALEALETPHVGVFDLDESVEVANFAIESRRLRVTLRGIALVHGDGPGGVDDAPDTVARWLLADLERASVSDGTDLADDEGVYRLATGSRVFVDDPAQPFVVVELDLEILYRTRFGRPDLEKA